MTWWIIGSVALSGLAAVMLMQSVSDLISLVAIAVGRKRPPPLRPDEAVPYRFLFMVPAHDEEPMIAQCVGSLIQQDYPSDHRTVLVVADNCTDETAEVARAAGADVLERHDLSLRGKPYAVRWALEQLNLDDYDAIVIVDGDTEVDPGYASAMNRVENLPDKAAQAFNGISNPDASAITRMSEILADVFYRFVYPLRLRAGLNSPLTGAGMCVGARVLKRFGWPATSLSEDVEMYAFLTVEGVKTQCVPQARVYSQAAANLSTGDSQRQRWRAGRLAVLVGLGPAILTRRGVGLHQRLDLISELAYPGPAVHLGTVAVTVPLALLLPLPGGPAIALALLASLIRPVIFTSLTIASEPDPWGALKAFLYLPIYTAWRLVTELKAFAKLGDGRWVKTKRHLPEPNG